MKFCMEINHKPDYSHDDSAKSGFNATSPLFGRRAVARISGPRVPPEIYK